MGRRGNNRLLAVLILVSAALHALVVLRVAGLYGFGPQSFIELELKEPERPNVRSIPRPPRRNEPPPLEPAARPLEPDLPPLRPMPAARQEVEALAAEVPAPKPWTGFDGSVEAPSVFSFGSARDYFEMVRLKIESRKKYPKAAMERQMEGRVVVRFVIEGDGRVTSVDIAQRSEHEILNQAALEAVRAASPFPRPPGRFFSGPVSLEVAIVFELT